MENLIENHCLIFQSTQLVISNIQYYMLFQPSSLDKLVFLNLNAYPSIYIQSQTDDIFQDKLSQFWKSEKIFLRKFNKFPLAETTNTNACFLVNIMSLGLIRPFRHLLYQINTNNLRYPLLLFFLKSP